MISNIKGKGKGKLHPRTSNEGTEREFIYTCVRSLTSVLELGGCSAPRPGRFTPRKEIRYPLYRRLGGPQCRSGRVWKISPPPGFEPQNCPARCQSLYRLSYHGPAINKRETEDDKKGAGLHCYLCDDTDAPSNEGCFWLRPTHTTEP